MKKILLYSGGMDSWLIDKLWKPDIKLYIDMNTKYSKEEISRLPEDVILDKLDLGKWERDDAIIPLRNLYLLMWATNYMDNEGCIITMGCLQGDRSLDKQSEFCNKAQDLLNHLYQPQWWLPNGRKVEINQYFKQFTKAELLKKYIDQGGDIKKVWNETFSCYHPKEDGTPCRKCKPCQRKVISFYEFGFVDESWLSDIIPAIEKDMVPYIKARTYGRGKKEEDLIMKFYNEYKDYGNRKEI